MAFGEPAGRMASAGEANVAVRLPVAAGWVAFRRNTVRKSLHRLGPTPSD
jgi:hypothetical protein